MQPITVSITNTLPSAGIRLFIPNDETTLEYEDKILLNFDPTAANPISLLEGVGEYVRNTAIVNIIDSDRKLSHYFNHPEYSLFSAVLEINFGESEYSIEEGSRVLSSPITLQFRNNQNPFTVRLSSVTVATAEEMGRGFFINSITIDASSRAITGINISYVLRARDILDFMNPRASAFVLSRA